jgi:predicted HTH transcriptional regulator
VNINELYELVSIGEQRRNVEIKRSMSWNNPNTKAKIVKVILAMSNIRDGGYLIFGFEENGDSYLPVGINEDDLNSFDYDDVKSHVARFADPYVAFSMEIIEDEDDGKKFIVFTIKEFEEVPVICKRNGLENLREGDIYTRSRRLPSTTKVPTQSEMREIMDLGIEKGIRKFLERAQRAGLRVQPATILDEYDRELEDIL